MASDTRDASPYGTLATLGSIVLVAAALYWAQRVLVPVALAVLIAFILRPAVDALERLRLGRIPSIILVVLIALLIVGGFAAVVSAEIINLARDLPQHEDRIVAKIKLLTSASQHGLVHDLQVSFQELINKIEQASQVSVKSRDQQVVPVTIENNRFSAFFGAIGPAAEALAQTGLVTVLVIFILLQREDLRNRLVRLLGQKSLVASTRAIDEAAQRISRYLLMQLLTNLGFGLLLWAALTGAGMPYALFWGLLAGASRFVPYAGTWIAAALILLFDFAVSSGWGQPAIVLGVYLVLELAVANLVEPSLFGNTIGISPVALLVAAAFWAWLWGIIGLILSMPLTAVLAVTGKYVPGLDFLNILLNDQASLDAEMTYYQRLLAKDDDEALEVAERFVREHGPRKACDDVILPALVLAKGDRMKGTLPVDEERRIVESARNAFDNVIVPALSQEENCKDESEIDRSEVLVLCCPAQDDQDEVALTMLEALLRPSHCRVRVLPSTTLSGELVSQVRENHPGIVCIGSVSPEGIAPSRYLCKRLRLEATDLKILVGRWGSSGDPERVRDKLLSSGADLVGTTLDETRGQILPLVQNLYHIQQDPGARREAG
jgi:predicted PurR-regulated permease PerM